MATTAMSLSDYAAGLREVVQPYFSDNVPSQVKLLKVLKKNDNVQIMNDEFIAPIRTGRNSGVANLNGANAKLRSGFATSTRGTVSPKILTATFDINDVAIKGSKGDKQAIVSALKFQADSMMKDFSKNVNRQYFSDGYGVVGQVSGSVGAGTLSVIYPDSNLDDGRSVDFYGPINYDNKPTRYFAAGQAIGIGTAAADAGTISTVTGGTALGTLVVTGAPAIVANDAIYFIDGDEVGGGTVEIQGVRAALSSGTADYMGLSRSLDVMSPQILGTAANGALTVADMESVYMSALEYASEGDKYAWFLGKSLYQKFGDSLTAMRRTPSTVELVSGWSGLEFQMGNGSVAVFPDYDTPDGEAVLLNLNTWTVVELAPMGFVDDELLRRSDYITFQKVFSWYTNLMCTAPAANGRMLRRTK